MNRRTAIRNVVIITAGASLLPACSPADESPGISLHKLKLTRSEEKLVADLADAILPKTGKFAGAAELKSHEFALVMVDDCMSPEKQKEFLDGMSAFDKACKTNYGSGFSNLEPAKRKEWMKILEAVQDPKDANHPAASFYRTIKGYSIQSFTTGRQYLEDVVKWKLVPGPVYKGCVPV